MPKQYLACIDCGKERWVEILKGKPESLRCFPCANKLNRGPGSYNWKGGRRIDKGNGYVLLTLLPDDPFLCMANSNHEVLEHRYVVAKKLGRPLESWERIHHKGTRFLMDSPEDKQDNREENLERVTTSENFQIKQMAQRIDELERLLTRAVFILVDHDLIKERSKR